MAVDSFKTADELRKQADALLTQQQKAGSLGGQERAEVLPQERIESIAREGANARWHGGSGDSKK